MPQNLLPSTMIPAAPVPSTQTWPFLIHLGSTDRLWTCKHWPAARMRSCHTKGLMKWSWWLNSYGTRWKGIQYPLPSIHFSPFGWLKAKPAPPHKAASSFRCEGVQGSDIAAKRVESEAEELFIHPPEMNIDVPWSLRPSPERTWIIFQPSIFRAVDSLMMLEMTWINCCSYGCIRRSGSAWPVFLSYVGSKTCTKIQNPKSKICTKRIAT